VYRNGIVAESGSYASGCGELPGVNGRQDLDLQSADCYLDRIVCAPQYYAQIFVVFGVADDVEPRDPRGFQLAESFHYVDNFRFD
jgi:hypothetical protein